MYIRWITQCTAICVIISDFFSIFDRARMMSIPRQIFRFQMVTLFQGALKPVASRKKCDNTLHKNTVFCHFYLTSFRRRILVFKRGSRNPSDCILLFWNTTNTSFHMSLGREKCVMLVLLLEVVYGLAHDVKLKRFFQSLKNEKPRKLLSYDIPFTATPSFGYHVPFQLL